MKKIQLPGLCDLIQGRKEKSILCDCRYVFVTTNDKLIVHVKSRIVELLDISSTATFFLSPDVFSFFLEKNTMVAAIGSYSSHRKI